MTFDASRVTLGRSSRCDIQVPFSVVSSHHLTFQRAGNQYRFRDEDSTNGTELDGELLPPEEWVPLERGSEIRIVDVVIDVSVETEESELDAFTLAETGTMARQMLGDALAQDDPDRARFQVLEGADAGLDVPIPDHLESGTIGSAPDCLVALSGDELPPEVAKLSFSEGKFRIRPTSEKDLRLDGRALDEQRPLTDGDRLVIGSHVLEFHDPLESHLLELEGLEQMGDRETTPADEEADGSVPDHQSSGHPGKGSATQEPAGSSPKSGRSDEEGRPTPSSETGDPRDEKLPGTDSSEEFEEQTPAGADQRWGWLETVLLIVTVVFLLLVGAVLVVTFEVV